MENGKLKTENVLTKDQIKFIESLRNKFESIDSQAQEEIENESCYMDYARL